MKRITLAGNCVLLALDTELTDMNKPGVEDGANDQLTRQTSPLTPLLPPVLAPSAKAISCNQ